MSRSERLYALSEYLRRLRVPVTVGALARRFEVTERTIARDLATLRSQDLPIEGEPGRGGGLRLRAGAHMPPLALSVDEAVSLWLALRLARVLGAVPTARGLASATDKLLAAVPAVRRRTIESVLDRIVVTRPAAAGLLAAARPLDPARYRVCERAFTRSHVLQIRYRDRAGRISRRRIEPHGLLVAAPLWYVLAHDRLRDAPRAFRLDRIEQATLLTRERFMPRDPRRMFAEIEQHQLEQRD